MMTLSFFLYIEGNDDDAFDQLKLPKSKTSLVLESDRIMQCYPSQMTRGKGESSVSRGQHSHKTCFKKSICVMYENTSLLSSVRYHGQ